MSFSEATLRRTAQWADWFAREWKNEVPIRIHSSEVAPDGSPEWHPDFARWLTEERPRRRAKRDAPSRRTTFVMRRLRKYSVRSYEVCYRILMLGDRIEDTTAWLNQRAAANDIPFPDHRPNGPHYTNKDTMALLIAGIDFVRESW